MRNGNEVNNKVPALFALAVVCIVGLCVAAVPTLIIGAVVTFYYLLHKYGSPYLLTFFIGGFPALLLLAVWNDSGEDTSPTTPAAWGCGIVAVVLSAGVAALFS